MKLVKAPEIFLPNSTVNLEKWAVIACDQFTSERAYWDKLSQDVENSPSTLNLIYPEAYLADFSKEKIAKIHNNMNTYLKDGTLVSQGECLILVERRFPNYTRLGLMVAVDLDAYDYRKDNTKALIRPSEATVIERLPIRAEIKTGASLDLPHIILLMNDRKYDILNKLYDNRVFYEKIYDFELNQGGGHIAGYKISDKTVIKKILKELEDLNKTTKFLVGDGNHSLAAAKMCWENTRAKLNFWQKRNHPGRFALVELEDANDRKMVIEPIHRILFHIDDEFINGLQKICPKGKRVQKLHFPGNSHGEVHLPENSVEAICALQNYIDEYMKKHNIVEIDYIHNEKNLIDLVNSSDKCVGIEFPQIDKNELFSYVGKYGPMPRKSFSIGKAEDKRYYLEAKKLVK